jgi:hypothetical protein
MSEHEQFPTEDEQDRDEQVEDLDVPEEQQDDVAGGALSHKRQRGIK